MSQTAKRVESIRSELAIAKQAVADTARLLKGKARPWYEAGGLELVDEPAIQLEAGRVAVDLATAEAALAAARHDDAATGALDAARGLAGEAGLRAASHLFEAAGATAAADPADYGRHWRAVRASTIEDPIAPAFMAAGEAFLSDPGDDADGGPAHARSAEDLASRLRPDARARDELGTYPAEALQAYAASGLLSVSVPKTYGGQGVSFAQALDVSRRLAKADGSIGQISTIHYSMVELLARVGTEAQKARWLPAVVAGGRLGNAGAERGVRHAKITATRLEASGAGCYSLSGRKYYSTGFPGAAMNIVLASNANDRLVSVLVPADASGVRVVDDWRALGQRTTGSGSVILDAVPVAEADVLPRWFNVERPTTATAAANLAHVALDLGIARGALESVAPLLEGRRPGVHVLEAIGRLAARLLAGETLFQDAAERLDALAGEELTEEIVRGYSLQVSIVKAQAADLAVDAGEKIFDIVGAAALDPRLGLDRFWRDARTHSLHDPTRWRLMRIGEHLLTGRLPPRNRTN